MAQRRGKDTSRRPSKVVGGQSPRKFVRARLWRILGTGLILFLTAFGTLAFIIMIRVEPSLLDRLMLGDDAARVGDETISEQEFRREYLATLQNYQRILDDSYNPKDMGLAQDVMERLVERRLEYLSALRSKVRASEEEAFEVLREISPLKDENGNFSPENLNAFLRGNFHTEGTFVAELRRSLTLQKFQQIVLASSFVSTKEAELEFRANETKIDLDYIKLQISQVKATPSESEIRAFMESPGARNRISAFFNTHKSEFQHPDQVRARRIIIRYTEEKSTTLDFEAKTKEQALALAKNIEGRARSKSTDFLALARELSDDLVEREKGGDLGIVSKDFDPHAIFGVLSSLKQGEVSSVTEIKGGFQILKAEELLPSRNDSEEAATPEIARRIVANMKRDQVLVSRIQEFLEAAKIGRASEQMLKPYGLQWSSTGLFAANADKVPQLQAGDDVLSAGFSLHKVGEVYANAIKVADGHLIIRLRARIEPPVENLTQVLKRRMAEALSRQQASQTLDIYTRQTRQELSSQSPIRRNPRYMALDVRKGKDRASK